MMTMMATFLDVIDQQARSHYDEGKGLALRSLHPEADAAQLQQWFSMDYARFWSMQDSSVHQVRDYYAALCSSGHAGAWLGLHHGRAAFLVECYDPARDQVGEHYCVRPGDLGMHILIGPPTERIPGFSRAVFALVLRFMFDRLHAARIVVEPDVNNSKIHALNLSMGFVYAGLAPFREKTASLAFCTRAQFERAQLRESTQ
ncbi:acetyltransferase (GNAT) domain protein [Bordetella bronchiseptica E014]|uniref:alcaligin biosynthesis acetyltransferase AlcB n=1 Tax=Bordetella bronchiseptica TaxID=518 RepID=UPI0004A18CEF|nr:alcaligin biosynthesis acetyltransferase AlcB [Bordetella bronchiseptica]KDC13444.1 acetyltransferase (GNAT) domain protein [Bordetella bronchiseptica E014]RSB98951.1 N-acetyltransferase [Bordetella bronchiseptica]RSC08012.1 N-acetyltransferase [Bordetella bronchiseptica]